MLGGLVFTVSGAAHLVCPRAFEWVNRLAFKDSIRTPIYVTGPDQYNRRERHHGISSAQAIRASKPRVFAMSW